MKNYTHVIFDFNGTVFDDMQAGIDAINEMLRERGLPMIASVSEYREIFGFPVEDYYQRLGFDFEKEDFKTVLAPMWVERYLLHSRSSQLFSGVAPLVHSLRAAGKHCSILSASHSDMLREQLSERGGEGWFDEIWGTDSIHAYGKDALAASWRAAHPKALAVVLGDTTHDFEVARAMGADCILIAAGHQSKQRLLRCGVPVVDMLADCLPLLLSDAYREL